MEFKTKSIKKKRYLSKKCVTSEVLLILVIILCVVNYYYLNYLQYLVHLFFILFHLINVYHTYKYLFISENSLAIMLHIPDKKK